MDAEEGDYTQWTLGRGLYTMDAGEGDYTQWTLGKGTIHNGRWGRGLYTMDAEEGLRKGTIHNER